MKKGDTDSGELTHLGGKTGPSKKLETFPNKTPERYYSVSLKTKEFTCLCPVTGQPDFATIEVLYIPDKKIVESKSFKLYIWSYRDEKAFHEHVTNRMLDDLTKALDPHWCRVTGHFNIRGGVRITVKAEHLKTPKALESVSYGIEGL